MTSGTGIYICSGCEIGNCLNTKALVEKIAKEFSPAVCEEHTHLCSQDGIRKIENDIKAENLENIVIAACSGRVQKEKFSFSPDIRLSRVNIREQVTWSHIPQHEDTIAMAEDHIRMAIAGLLHSKKPEPYLPGDISFDIMVVGGGVTGITAALEASKAGYSVLLIEKEKRPGGHAAKLYKQYPVEGDPGTLLEPEIFGLIEQVETSDVKIMTSALVESVSGEPGNFKVLVQDASQKKEMNIGSIVLAAGFRPYDANNLVEYGYGTIRNVITQEELEEKVRKNKIRQEYPRNNLRVLFIQCAGSRDAKHLPYCSNYCCATSLKQTRYLRDLYPESQIFILYKDIRSPGFLEAFYREAQTDDSVFFTKGEFTQITSRGDTSIISVDNTSLGEPFNLEVDMVVLATGMTPVESNILNLTYRQGKGLPVLKYDFSDSHFICFPYETRRTGIYAAGTCRSPMDIAECKKDASGAALKAIQCVESIKRGEAVHPRAGDTSYPKLYLERCTDCKRCTEECPFGAYDETATGTPLPNPARCRRCAICMGSCPERIINFDDFSIDSVGAMIKSVHIPDEFEEKPRILVFVCENDAYPALDMAGINRLHFSPHVRIIPVRCIGSVNKSWITDALSHGFDGILLLGCKPGEDYQCHFITGSELTRTRGENFSEALETMMLEPERVKVETVEINEYEKIVQIINEYAEEIGLIGPNPFKGL